MSSKMSIIAEHWGRWLRRYVPPVNLRSNDTARGDEQDAHVKTLARYAPDADPEAWLARLTARLDSMARTSAWPRVAEIEEACMGLRRDDALHGTVPTQSGSGLDPFAIAAKRMATGQPVGEGYLWGVNAVALLRRGLVDEGTITDYRRGAYAARLREDPETGTSNRDEVDEWLAERQEAHASALRVDAAQRRAYAEGARQGRRATPFIPDMTSPARDDSRLEQVRTAVAKLPAAFGVADVAGVAGLPEGPVRRILGRMSEAGEIVATGDGYTRQTA